jgi:hypothetical protein
MMISLLTIPYLRQRGDAMETSATLLKRLSENLSILSNTEPWMAGAILILVLVMSLLLTIAILRALSLVRWVLTDLRTWLAEEKREKKAQETGTWTSKVVQIAQGVAKMII